MRLVLGALSAAAALAVVEVGLRYVGGVFHDDLSRLDPIRGWTLRPNAAGWVRNERTLWVEINGDGLRDREHAIARRDDTLRVAVLGDSYMQGLNVPLDKTFPTLLEGVLRRCLPPRWQNAETFNFGVSGYGTAQELLTYRHHGRRYRPDIVLLAFYAGNDVFNNHRQLNPTEHRDLSPYFTLEGGTLVLDRAFEAEVAAGAKARQPWWRRIRMSITERSRVAQLLYMGWAAWRDRWGAPTDDEAEDPDAITDEEVFRPPTRPEVIDAWRVSEALVLQLAAEVRADGAELWMVTLSTANQVNPNVAERAELAQSLGVDSLFYPDRRMVAFAEANAIPVIPLAEVFAERAVADGVFFHGGYNDEYPAGTGHWNETANQLAAQLVADRLCGASRAGAETAR